MTNSWLTAPMLGHDRRTVEQPHHIGLARQRNNAAQSTRRALTAGRRIGSVVCRMLFENCRDPAMHDAALRALVALAHSENLWVSCEPQACRWLIDGPTACVVVGYGADYAQWRQALLQAAGVTRCSVPARASAQ